MATVQIDISGEEGSMEVRNEIAFDLTIAGCGVELAMSFEQARQVFNELSKYFGEDAVHD